MRWKCSEVVRAPVVGTVAGSLVLDSEQRAWRCSAAAADASTRVLGRLKGFLLGLVVLECVRGMRLREAADVPVQADAVRRTYAHDGRQLSAIAGQMTGIDVHAGAAEIRTELVPAVEDRQHAPDITHDDRQLAVGRVEAESQPKDSVRVLMPQQPHGLDERSARRQAGDPPDSPTPRSFRRRRADGVGTQKITMERIPDLQKRRLRLLRPLRGASGG